MGNQQAYGDYNVVVEQTSTGWIAFVIPQLAIVATTPKLVKQFSGPDRDAVVAAVRRWIDNQGRR